MRHYRTNSWDKSNPFSTYWSWCTCRYMVQKWYWSIEKYMSYERRTTFAPTQGLHISGYVPSRHGYCNSHISSYEWKIWIITTRQLRGYVTLFFPYFIKVMESHIGQYISQATEMQTLCLSKTSPSFSGADNSYISWPINTIFAPRIGMYIRINIPKMDFIYLKIWCNSFIFCQRGHLFLLTLYTQMICRCLQEEHRIVLKVFRQLNVYAQEPGFRCMCLWICQCTIPFLSWYNNLSNRLSFVIWYRANLLLWGEDQYHM